MKKVAIVIPMHKKNLSEIENISLLQAVKIFRNYDKFFVLPCSLEYSYTINSIKEIRFEDSWFKNSKKYNELLIDEEFYKSFIEYDYILIYQLDAFVFEDKLEYFCDLGYDYIGAPWLSGLQCFMDFKYTILHVGNGGFSLRNVIKCIELIKQKRQFFLNYVNEDIFFSMGTSDNFRIAPLKIALNFSFEREVEKSFELNKNKLPFGCHAWERYDLKFWKPYIEQYGYKIDEKYLLKGNEDIILKREYERQKKIAFFWEKIYKKETLEKFINKQNKKIYIWGAGQQGRFLGKLLSETKTQIEGYLDNNVELIGTYIEKYKILSIQQFEKNIKYAYVIIAIDKYEKNVAQQLDKIGCSNYIFYKDIFQIFMEETNLKFEENEI